MVLGVGKLTGYEEYHRVEVELGMLEHNQRVFHGARRNTLIGSSASHSTLEMASHARLIQAFLPAWISNKLSSF